MQKTQGLGKRASFEELCPDWSNAIMNSGEFTSLKDHAFNVPMHGNVEGKIRERDLAKPMCCIVGEAHE